MTKLHWHQGLFLQPQHFEFLEQSLEEKIKFISQNNPYFWGVKEFEVDEESLLHNELKLSKLKIILKNGTIITNENSIIINKLLSPTTPKTLIYIGIQNLNNDANVEEINDFSNLKGNKTFVSDVNGEEVYDLYEKDEKVNIRFLKYVVKLFTEDEVKNIANYHLVPILELKNEDGFELDRYIPPVININDFLPLKNLIKRIYEIISIKINNLNEYKLPFSSNYSSDKYMKFLMVLQILNRYATDFYIFFETQNTHPLKVYKTLRKLIAEISVFSNRIDYLGNTNNKKLLNNYNHTNLKLVFDSFKTLIDELLDEIIIGPEYMINLQKENGIFYSKLEPYLFEKEYNFYLIVKPINIQTFHQNILAKISSKEKIDTLIQRALDGVKIEKIDAIEGIPIRDNVIYLQIDIHSKEWLIIKQYLNISIFIDEVEEITLIAMKG